MKQELESFILKLDICDKYQVELLNKGFECVNDVLLYMIWDRLGGTLEVDQPSGSSWDVNTEDAGWR